MEKVWHWEQEVDFFTVLQEHNADGGQQQSPVYVSEGAPLEARPHVPKAPSVENQVFKHRC